ncbi:pilus assembly protein [Frankia sp. AgPm24]|uniref:TadE/TadG family type IV pilus assembly protein n=1 Tax=Frankia sp. AgPm24 TaxID=631128 RepID=UPI00200FBBC8|nr:TadE/TadG family type IV pilus assembly protein [Frankia sp. AgPm24]MCK9921184.1 pilus assembly protein [Frankia sp. AgPm24]
MSPDRASPPPCTPTRTRPAKPPSAFRAGRRAVGRLPCGSTDGKDTGAASTELVVATPLILLMLLLVVQLAVWGWAEQVASAAARRGVDAARLAGADPQAGPTAAELITSQIGGGVLTDPQITVTQTSPTLLTVTVTGTAIRYLPGLGLHVNAHASGTRETYQP